LYVDLNQVVVEELEVQKELFYTEGEDALLEARKSIAAWSLPRAAARIAAAKQLRQGGLDVLKVRWGEMLYLLCVSQLSGYGDRQGMRHSALP
jgi:hypothetical protein